MGSGTTQPGPGPLDFRSAPAGRRVVALFPFCLTLTLPAIHEGGKFPLGERHQAMHLRQAMPPLGRLPPEQLQAPLRKTTQPLDALLLMFEKGRPGPRPD